MTSESWTRLENAFMDTRIKLAYYQRIQTQVHRRALLVALNSFIDIVSSVEPQDIIELVQEYRQELSSMQKTFRTIGDASAVAVRQRGSYLFTLIKMSNNPPTNMTIMFGEFVKGVTYFETQDVGMPVYHRLYSCGPKAHTKPFRDGNTICLPATDSSEKARRKLVAETCYIERLIYNQIYEHENAHIFNGSIENTEQDRGHHKAIYEANKDFVTCCKRCSIHVNLDFNALGPISVTIKRYSNNRLRSTETYNRAILHTGRLGIGWKYDALVSCTRTVGTREYIKFQSFNLEGPWVRNFGATTDDIPDAITTTINPQFVSAGGKYQ